MSASLPPRLEAAGSGSSYTPQYDRRENPLAAAIRWLVDVKVIGALLVGGFVGNWSTYRELRAIRAVITPLGIEACLTWPVEQRKRMLLPCKELGVDLAAATPTDVTAVATRRAP